MMQNNFLRHLQQLYTENSRRMRFQGAIQTFESWKAEARSRVIELLQIADLPTYTTEWDFNPELETVAEEEFPNYRLTKVKYQTLPHLTVSAYLLKPKGNDRPRPAILCPPGHGKGINQVMGEAESGYHLYPIKLAEAGYVAFVPEHISFGERANPEPYHGCRFDHEALILLGSTVIGYRMWELQRALDILTTLPAVDSNRIGFAGLSLGG